MNGTLNDSFKISFKEFIPPWNIYPKRTFPFNVIIICPIILTINNGQRDDLQDYIAYEAKHVFEIQWASSGGPKIKPCQPCKIISTIYQPIIKFPFCPIPAIRSKPSFNRGLIAFWVLLRQQILNAYCVSALSAKIYHVVKNTPFHAFLYKYHTNRIVPGLQYCCKIKCTDGP